jgi:hypothetical protein
LAEWWADFARSLRRRGRSEATVGLYRQVDGYFWAWALTQGVDEPATITTDVVNRWVDQQRTRFLAYVPVARAFRADHLS